MDRSRASYAAARLGEESTRHWKEIQDRTFVFDRRQRDAENVEKISAQQASPTPHPNRSPTAGCT